MATLATETWTGTTGAAWPAQWSVRRGTATIQSNAGRLVTSATSTYEHARADLSSSGMAVAGDTDMLVSFTALATGVNQLVSLHIDSDGVYNVNNGAGGWYPDNGYVLEINMAPTASGSAIGLYDMSAGNQIYFTDIGGLTIAGGVKNMARLQRSGSTLRAKVWAASGAEPTPWTLSWTVSTIRTGRVGITCSNGDTAAVRSFDFDDLVVTTDGTTGVPAGSQLLRLGGATPSAVYLGSASPSAVYLGTTKVWP